MKSQYQFVRQAISSLPALAILTPFTQTDAAIFLPAGMSKPVRKSLNGLWLFRITIEGHDYAFAYSDFRVNGGSFGQENSSRFHAFLEEITASGLPLIFAINSMGVSLFEGRTVFQSAFSLIPALERFKQQRPVYTVALNNVYGLGALLFGLGSYRVSINQQSRISLAGPQVFKLFFNKQENFEENSTVDIHQRGGKLVHEICFSEQHALSRIFCIHQQQMRDISQHTDSGVFISSYYHKPSTHKQLEHAFVQSIQLLEQFIDNGTEVFPNFDTRLKAFIGTINNIKVGILINPVGYPHNLLSENSLTLFTEALSFFRDCQLPVISILDTPGADPHVTPGNYRIIEKMIDTGRAIMDYPYKKIGIIAGRAYGGATILGFPKIFGGYKHIALPGADLGIMKHDIIESLLSGSESMLNTWKSAIGQETAGLEDLLKLGIIDCIKDSTQLKSQLIEWLKE